MQAINHPTIATDGIVRPTLVEIDQRRLAENFRTIKAKVAPARVMPILKANAYGHGLVEIAKLMETLGADYLGTAVVEEGILRCLRCQLKIPGWYFALFRQILQRFVANDSIYPGSKALDFPKAVERRPCHEPRFLHDVFRSGFRQTKLSDEPQ